MNRRKYCAPKQAQVPGHVSDDSDTCAPGLYRFRRYPSFSTMSWAGCYRARGGASLPPPTVLLSVILLIFSDTGPPLDSRLPIENTLHRRQSISSQWTSATQPHGPRTSLPSLKSAADVTALLPSPYAAS